MTTILHCPHCGTANRARSNFCNNCGANLRGETAPAPPTETPEAGDQASSPAGHQPHEESSGAASELGTEQPWLQPDDLEDALPAEQPSGGSPRRLVANVQGLLDPVRVFSEASDENEVAATVAMLAPVVALSGDKLRRYRVLMSEEPLLEEGSRVLVLPWLPALRLPAILLLLGGLMALSFVLQPTTREGQTVQPWPGVDEAYDVIEGLRPGAAVLLYWAYDPATAGEMELLALPLATHLASRQVQPRVFSVLPNGLASARRLFAQVAAPNVEARQLQLAVGDAQMTSSIFLPGGAALPLVAENPAASLNDAAGVGAAGLLNAAEATPALAIILAAQAEDVQEWLEQAQPLNQIPVVAFTSAAADPVLRPYLESGQLGGLVSGFDGAWAYQHRSGLPLGGENEARLNAQLTRQTWGHLALFLAILLGNLAALFGRESHG